VLVKHRKKARSKTQKKSKKSKKNTSRDAADAGVAIILQKKQEIEKKTPVETRRTRVSPSYCKVDVL
jgi:hypothetical protein